MDNASNRSTSQPLTITIKSGSDKFYLEDFDDGKAQDWISNSGNWIVKDNSYRHQNGDGEYISVYDASTFTNYIFSAEAKPDWINNFGLVFNFQDNQDYYLLSIEVSSQKACLNLVKDGQISKIDSSAYEGGAGTNYSIEINCKSGKTSVKLDNEIIFNQISTPEFIFGEIGVYAWWNPVRFNNIKVVESDEETGIFRMRDVSELNIFPNPLSGKNMKVKLNEFVRSFQLWIYNMDGKLIYEELKHNNSQFNFSGLKTNSPGMYLLKAIGDGTLYQAKIAVL